MEIRRAVSGHFPLMGGRDLGAGKVPLGSELHFPAVVAVGEMVGRGKNVEPGARGGGYSRVESH